MTGVNMKSLRKYLQEQSIDYNLQNIQSIVKQNTASAKSLLNSLSKEELNDFIEQINKTENYKQFLDSKKDRDLAVATYIVKEKDPDFAEKIGLSIENPETFNKTIKDDIISPTRKRANEQEINSPKVKSNTGEEADTEAEEDDEKGSKTKEDGADDEKGSKTKEDDADVREPEAEENDDDDEKGSKTKEERKARIEKGVKRDVEKGAESSKNYNYKKTIDKLKETQEEALSKLGDLEKNAENKKDVNKQKSVVQSKVDKLIKRVQKAEEGLITNPELKAKQALTELETVTKNAVLKAQRAQLSGKVGRTAKKIEGIAGRAKRGVKGASEKIKGSATYKQTKEVGRVAGKKIKDVQQQVQSNARANFIAKQLNYGDARKWITATDNKTKEEIYQKALKKSRDTRQKKSAVAGSRSKGNTVKMAGQQQKKSSIPNQKKTQRAQQRAIDAMNQRKRDEIMPKIDSPTASGSPIKKTS
jgi:hypothetical protein